jgi:hypothetical protein
MCLIKSDLLRQYHIDPTSWPPRCHAQEYGR